MQVGQQYHGGTHHGSSSRRTSLGVEGRTRPSQGKGGAIGRFGILIVLERHGERMIKRNFDPGFRIELHQPAEYRCRSGNG
jgi:hypothetical protein